MTGLACGKWIVGQRHFGGHTNPKRKRGIRLGILAGASRLVWGTLWIRAKVALSKQRPSIYTSSA